MRRDDDEEYRGLMNMHNLVFSFSFLSVFLVRNDGKEQGIKEIRQYYQISIRLQQKTTKKKDVGRDAIQRLQVTTDADRRVADSTAPCCTSLIVVEDSILKLCRRNNVPKINHITLKVSGESKIMFNNAVYCSLKSHQPN